jgi:ankyrin repeat protein
VQWADQPEVVDVLVAHGADINARDHYDLTPIFLAQHVEVAKELVAKGAVLTGVARDGRTPLHFATKGPLVNDEFIAYLLQQHLDPNARDQQGRTPLHWAATGSNPGIITALIAGGAKVNIRDNGGNTPLALAQQAKLDDAVLELQQAGAKE